MAHINRKYIDKHWIVFILRGILAVIFGWFILFGNLDNLQSVIAIISVYLLVMGIIDSCSALYNSTKKHGWLNSVIDAAIDVIAALLLLFAANNDLVFTLITISAYTFISGVIDIIHSCISTKDPTDRFIRGIAGVCGILMGLVILNSGAFEMMTFMRFFGAYVLIIGVTSLIYGVHNRSQNIEDKIARKEAAKSRKTSKKSK